MTGFIQHISVGGPVQTIVARGERFRFEMHPYCGPVLTNLDNSEKAQQPGKHNPFWRAVELWDKQGRKFNSNGTCKWVAPPPEPLYHLGGKHYTHSKEIAEKFSGILVSPEPSP